MKRSQFKRLISQLNGTENFEIRNELLVTEALLLAGKLWAASCFPTGSQNPHSQIEHDLNILHHQLEYYCKYQTFDFEEWD